MSHWGKVSGAKNGSRIEACDIAGLSPRGRLALAVRCGGACPRGQEDGRRQAGRSRHRRKRCRGEDAGLLPNPLQKYGVKFAATYIGEVLGNVSGGLKRGAIYEGRLN